MLHCGLALLFIRYAVLVVHSLLFFVLSFVPASLGARAEGGKVHFREP